jgi:hypothetical protein
MSDQNWRRKAANDQAGFYHHSSICTCGPCLATYEQHNAGYEVCVCNVCEAHNYDRNVPYQSDAKGNTVVATVNFCERCNSMGQSKAMGALAYRTDATKGDVEMEICPGCVDDFITWLKSDVMTSRERAYMDPWKEDTEPEKQGTILSKETLRTLLKELEAGE